MNVTDLYIIATTALTLLFFSVVGGEFGFYCSFIVFVMWFMIWCAIKTLVAIIDASRDQEDINEQRIYDSHSKSTRDRRII